MPADMLMPYHAPRSCSSLIVLYPDGLFPAAGRVVPR